MAHAKDHGHANMQAAYAITVLFELREDAFEEFHRLVCENASRSVQSEVGCYRFDVLVPLVAGGQPQVLLYELYSSRAAFETHLATEHFLQFDEQTRPMVTRKSVQEFSLSEHAKSGLPV